MLYKNVLLCCVPQLKEEHHVIEAGYFFNVNNVRHVALIVLIRAENYKDLKYALEKLKTKHEIGADITYRLKNAKKEYKMHKTFAKLFFDLLEKYGDDSYDQTHKKGVELYHLFTNVIKMVSSYDLQLSPQNCCFLTEDFNFV